jgi:hypothetical protein
MPLLPNGPCAEVASGQACSVYLPSSHRDQAVLAEGMAKVWVTVPYSEYQTTRGLQR